MDIRGQSLDYEKIESFRKNSPSLKLLRANNLALIISFLYREFKEPNRITIPHFELIDKLVDYLEYHGEEESVFEDLIEKAKRYIDEWCGDDNNYLGKYPNEDGIDVLELTPSTEKVIQWLQELDKRDFVGTESRFLDIFHKLRELVENSTENPEQRIAVLEKKQQEIEQQIQQIRDKGVVLFDETQIKERFDGITRVARTLSSDFQEVKQNFKDIGRGIIYEKQGNRQPRKGEILGYALDATDKIEESDQGKSFSAFWRFLMDSSKQNELEQLVEEVYNLLNQRNIAYHDTYLKQIKFYLYRAGQQVIDSKRLLVSKLSRILAGKSSAEKKRTTELLNDIKELALKAIEHPPATDVFFDIDGDPNICLDMERPLGQKPQEISLKSHPSEIGGLNLDEVDFGMLYRQFEINKEELEKHIALLLNNIEQVALTDILKVFPLRNGLAELLTYYSIASQSSRHVINEKKYETISLYSDSSRIINVPQIIFTK